MYFKFGFFQIITYFEFSRLEFKSKDEKRFTLMKLDAKMYVSKGQVISKVS